MQLLNQHVDVLNLITAETKLAVITNFEFSQILTQLKRYLEMTDYLCQYISHYVIIVKSLQLCKTLLNQRIHQNHEKNAEKNQQWWLVSHINIVRSTSKKLNVFHHLQKLFLRFTILSHFDLKHQLYIDLNVSKKFDFSVHVYHTKFSSDNHRSAISMMLL